MITSEHVWWAGANILFPFLVPVFLFRFIQWIGHGQGSPEQQERLRITYLLKEGQFGLSGGAVAAAAFYELMSTSGALNYILGKALLVSLIVLGALSILVFVIGTVFVAPPPILITKNTDYLTWLKTYRVGAASIYLAAAVAFCACVAHVHASPPKEEAKTGDKAAESKAIKP